MRQRLGNILVGHEGAEKHKRDEHEEGAGYRNTDRISVTSNTAERGDNTYWLFKLGLFSFVTAPLVGLILDD